MFRILFFILICTLGFYTFWWIYNPVKELSGEQISEDFNAYLSGALARNSSPSETYNVYFYKEDFIDIKERTNYFQATTSLDYLNESHLDRDMSGALVVTTGTQDIGRDSRLSEFPVSISWWDDNCNWGILFDPCLILDDPIPADGRMYFGSKPYIRNINSEQKSIYVWSNPYVW